MQPLGGLQGEVVSLVGIAEDTEAFERGVTMNGAEQINVITVMMGEVGGVTTGINPYALYHWQFPFRFIY